jgi:hypothetical protein
MSLRVFLSMAAVLGGLSRYSIFTIWVRSPPMLLLGDVFGLIRFCMGFVLVDCACLTILLGYALSESFLYLSELWEVIGGLAGRAV